MKFTFGVVTTTEPQRMSRNTNNHIREMIDAIRANEIPEDSYEIIIVGGDNEYHNDKDVTHFYFDDIHPKPGWFTRKKNMITENAKFDNIVFSHDYIRLDKDFGS